MVAALAGKCFYPLNRFRFPGQDKYSAGGDCNKQKNKSNLLQKSVHLFFQHGVYNRLDLLRADDSGYSFSFSGFGINNHTAGGGRYSDLNSLIVVIRYLLGEFAGG